MSCNLPCYSVVSFAADVKGGSNDRLWTTRLTTSVMRYNLLLYYIPP